MSIEAMKQALTHEIDLVLIDPESQLSGGAQRALQYVHQQIQAIAEAEKQEPVAWIPIIDGVSQRPLTSKAQAEELKALGAVVKPLVFGDTPQPAQPKAEKQEPIGYLEIEDVENQREYPHACRAANLWYEGGEGLVAVYTHPQQKREWVGLTDEEIDTLLWDTEWSRLPEIAKAIEAKLKAKNFA